MLHHFFSRGVAIAALMFAFNAVNAWGQAVTVVEYYSKTLDAYFITGRASEQATLDTVAAFQRTGMTFTAVSAGSAPASLTKICRFYISTATPYTSSHFYGRQSIDCEPLRTQNLPGFTYEDYDFAVPAPVASCASPIYRGFRVGANGKTSNHRYSAGAADYASAVAAGYVGEAAVFCATSSTPVTALVTPPMSGSGDCSGISFSSARITYLSTGSGSGAALPTSTFVRSYNTTPVSFFGHPALQIVDTVGGNTTSSMIQDVSTAWSELGVRSITGGVVSEMYFVPPIQFPKTMTVGQRLDFTRELQFSPAAATGTGNQTGTFTFVGRESVTVPAGTFSACKFSTTVATKYPTIGSSSVTTATSWLVANVGLVRTEVTDTTTVSGFTIPSTSSLVATAVQ